MTHVDDPIDPRAATLSDEARHALDVAREDLRQAQAARDHHERIAQTGMDTNPAGDLGGIRSRSAKQRARIGNRFDREAKRGIALWRARENAAARVEDILSGAWLRAQHDAQRRKDHAATVAAGRRQRPPCPEHPRMPLVPIWYNAAAQRLHDQMDAERQRAVAQCSLNSHDHARQAAAGSAEPFLTVMAEIVAAHSCGEMITTARLVMALRVAHAAARRAAHEHPQSEPIQARTAGLLARADSLIAQLEQGALALVEAPLTTAERLDELANTPPTLPCPTCAAVSPYAGREQRTYRAWYRCPQCNSFHHEDRSAARGAEVQ